MPDPIYTLGTPAHQAWLADRTDELFRFYQRSADVARGGFSALNATGNPTDAPKELYLTARMTYCFALGTLLGRGDADLVEHGLTALRTIFHDDADGGWFAQLRADASAPTDTTKATYAHAFVLLAASTATVAGYDCADIVAEAVTTYDRYLWDGHYEMCVDEWDAGWRHRAAYRGLNANMHSVEAFLAAYEATGDPVHRTRAAGIGRRVIRLTTDFDGRLPEHFSSDWVPEPAYNEDHPADQFRPYGATPGHSVEWARLLLQLRSVDGGGDELLETAERLFARAVDDAWEPDRFGFAYTVDWTGQPVVVARLHWPLAEAIGAAASLYGVTRDPRYADWYGQFWALADRAFVDHVLGGWHHELTPDGAIGESLWVGKPDLYHALQATLFARASDGVGLLSALRR